MSEKQADKEVMLTLLTQKKEVLFARINRLYNTARNITSFELISRTNENFLADSETIDDIRDKFESVVDQLNQIKLQLKSDAIPDYGCLEAFEDLFTKVKRVRNKLLAATTTVVRSHEASNSTMPVVKLEPLCIPVFDGRAENWNLFYQSFKANIHLNERLSDSQRVQYLISKLTNDARKFTAGIVPTGESYNILWDSLVKKFQDKRALGTDYLNNILDLKANSHNANALDAFISKFSASMSALKLLEINDLTDFIFVQCALRKLDTQTVESFELSVRDTEIPTSAQLISFVQDQAKILERSRPSASLNKTPSSGPSRDNKGHNTYKSFVATQNTSSDPVPSIPAKLSACVLCSSSDHLHLYNCAQFKKRDPHSRYEFIKSIHGCVNCLSSMHNLPKCNSTSVCEHCKKRHHSLLCFTKINSDNNCHSHTALVTPNMDNNVQSLPPSVVGCGVVSDACTSTYISTPSFASRQATQSQPNCPINKDHISIALASNTCSSQPPSPQFAAVHVAAGAMPKSTILLSTAQVYARPKGSVTSSIVRCLIDNGSQNHLITIDCCRKLNLPITPLHNSSVKGVGAASRPIIGYVYVDLQSRVYPQHQYTIYALVVDCIAEQLPDQLVELDSRIFSELQLADLSWNVPGNIDILLGAQLFPYIYLGNKVECASLAPPALSTTFGWVLMGDYPRKDITLTSTSFSALALSDVVEKFWELEKVDKKSLSLVENTSIVTHDNVDHIPQCTVVQPDKQILPIKLDINAKTLPDGSLVHLIGFNFQSILFITLLDFRWFPTAVNADIVIPSLRIGVPIDQRKYLRILFRFNEPEEIRSFAYNRQPLSLESCQFIAMRTVRQLASDLSPQYPDAAKVVQSSLHINNSERLASKEGTVKQQMQIFMKLFFESGFFDFDKWASNSPAFVNNLADSHRKSLSVGVGDNILNILSLSWDPYEDAFLFTSTVATMNCTMRNMLPLVAHLVDFIELCRGSHDPPSILTLLLCAKSKVSPTKITTLAHLELCAALLMAKLAKIVQDIYTPRFPLADTFLDSTIALLWIRFSPQRCLASMTNYSMQCQVNLAAKHIFYVISAHASFCFSRGTLPSQFSARNFWLNDPPWIRCSRVEWSVEPRFLTYERPTSRHFCVVCYDTRSYYYELIHAYFFMFTSFQFGQNWPTPDKPVEVGTVVLVEQENAPPLHWPLGIIIEVFKSANDTVRFAMVKTKFGVYKRAVTKLYPVPTQ